jgi:hypothetical protein
VVLGASCGGEHSGFVLKVCDLAASRCISLHLPTSHHIGRGLEASCLAPPLPLHLRLHPLPCSSCLYALQAIVDAEDDARADQTEAAAKIVQRLVMGTAAGGK